MRDHATAAVHFGVIAIPDHPDALDPFILGVQLHDAYNAERLAAITAGTASGTARWTCERDDYAEWGEPVNVSLHVTVLLDQDPGTVTRDQVVNHLRADLAARLPAGMRVVDYAVVTDADNYSRGARVVGFYA